MKPSSPQVRQAAENLRRPPRTLHARVRDALAHARQSSIKKPAEKQFSLDGLKGIRDENTSTSDSDPHL